MASTKFRGGHQHEELGLSQTDTNDPREMELSWEDVATSAWDHVYHGCRTKQAKVKVSMYIDTSPLEGCEVL